ncbi:MAG TPA: hypothetical protein VFW00_02240 [Rhodocyclaceae bacterium]|nr:hypothetical protein [Rhodocyclaceae bacterium]
MNYLFCFAMFAVIFVGNAYAEGELPAALLSGFESKHGDHRTDLNPHNPGIGYRFQDGWTLGTYYNSIRRHSFYAGREWQYKLFGGDTASVNLGGVAGVVTGYLHGPHLLLIPEAIFQYQHVEASLILIPRVTKDPITMAIQLRWRI